MLMKKDYCLDFIQTGIKTCAGRPGSLDYKGMHAKKYAEWGVDYLIGPRSQICSYERCLIKAK